MTIGFGLGKTKCDFCKVLFLNSLWFLIQTTIYKALIILLTTGAIVYRTIMLCNDQFSLWKTIFLLFSRLT